MPVSGANLVWFRQDLRVRDNPALTAALAEGKPVVPIFIWAPEEEGKWVLGAASKWWLYHSLEQLKESLKELGLHLVIRRGNSLEQLQKVIREADVEAVYWNRRYEPSALKGDAEVKAALKKEGIACQSFNGNLLFEPWTIANKAGKPYQVFTPFYKQVLSQKEPEEPLPKPKRGHGPQVEGISLKALDLLPHIHWDTGIQATWKPGEAAALKRIQTFIAGPIADYVEERDRPDHDGTSRISPYLHFGEITPRQIWHAVLQKDKKVGEPYLRQLIWREFAYHLLYHFPKTPTHPLRPEFETFPWEYNQKQLKAWQKGLTGYPIVDAGMRQLWTTGWMHNRVRMIVGSFLVKDLRLHWLEGARWFWDTLVDADLANNTLGWQWVGGCGADAAPYFRIFNPVTQGEKFDPEGTYVRQWVPALKKLPNKWIHSPWKAPAAILEQGGVNLGKNYPEPLVDHAEARESALKAFKKIR